MKVLFLRSFFAVEKFYFPAAISEPLGLETLTAFLRKDYQIKILDAVGEGWYKYWTLEDFPETIFLGLKSKEIIKKISEFQPDVIGITWLFSAQNDSVNIITKTIKETYPDLIIIAGGPHPSTNPKEVLGANPYIDIIIYGEGEITFKELLDKKMKNLEEIKGIAYKKYGQIIINPPRELIKNLDIIPLPARNLLNYKNYAKQNFYIFIYHRLKKLKIKEKIIKTIASFISRAPLLDQFYYKLHNSKKMNEFLPTADIVTSRGCPNRCTFCAVHNLWGHSWRMRSAENVLTEIDELVNKYQIKHINVQDDNFNISKSRIIEICQKIVERKYNITLSANSGVYVPALDEKVLTWLKKAGFRHIRMCIESGNQEVLDKIIKKRIDLSKIKNIIDVCQKIGLKTEGAFMFGVPGETIASMQQTLKFANSLGFNRVKKFIFQPFPNTELYDVCVKNNYLTEDYNPREIYVTGNKSFVKTENFLPEDVVKIARGK